jgi:hypothetical protein
MCAVLIIIAIVKECLKTNLPVVRFALRSPFFITLLLVYTVEFAFLLEMVGTVDSYAIWFGSTTFIGGVLSSQRVF